MLKIKNYVAVLANILNDYYLWVIMLSILGALC